jgi:hypothetical protein
MAIDNASKMTAIRKAIKILRKGNSSRKKGSRKKVMMNVNEMNYVVDTLKDIEKQLQIGQDEQTGTA